jgi:hypothetical protein
MIKISRIWAMPNKWTFTIKPIANLINEEVTNGVWIDSFCGKYSPATITNDVNPEIPADYHLDALEFLKQMETESAKGVFFDPPYSITQASECYKKYGKEKLEINVSNMKYWAECKNEIARIIKSKGKVICCGWNSMGLGKGRGFKMNRILLVPHGGSKNDTIVTVEIKQKSLTE